MVTGKLTTVKRLKISMSSASSLSEQQLMHIVIVVASLLCLCFEGALHICCICHLHHLQTTTLGPDTERVGKVRDSERL